MADTTLPARHHARQPATPSVYLAGKIEKNCWRGGLVPGLRGVDGDQAFDPGLTLPGKGFTYTGPFFVACDHGCGHGAFTHGMGVGCYGERDLSPGLTLAATVVELSLLRIRRADVVFAWIDAPDAYGTLVELGYARAMGKFIALQFSRQLVERLGFKPSSWPFERGACDYGVDTPGTFDMWFAAELADYVAVTPGPFLADAIENWRDAQAADGHRRKRAAEHAMAEDRVALARLGDPEGAA